MAILLIRSLIFSDYIKLGQARYSDFWNIPFMAMLHLECDDTINQSTFLGYPQIILNHPISIRWARSIYIPLTHWRDFNCLKGNIVTILHTFSHHTSINLPCISSQNFASPIRCIFKSTHSLAVSILFVSLYEAGWIMHSVNRIFSLPLAWTNK